MSWVPEVGDTVIAVDACAMDGDLEDTTLTINKRYTVKEDTSNRLHVIDDQQIPHCFEEGWSKYFKQLDIKTPRKSGGSTSYYELPEGATELRHLIRHKQMPHPIGEAFCALYRLNDNGEYRRNLEKVIFYCQAEMDEFDKEQKEL